MKMLQHEAFACCCGKGDVVLRESYRPHTRGQLYYAFPLSKPRKNEFGCKKILWKEQRVRLLAASLGASRTPSYSLGPSTPPSDSPGPSRNAECSNLKLLTGMIK
ncbi:hypothetical protein Tco_1127554, partial [Tanacetum coccineum]